MTARPFVVVLRPLGLGDFLTGVPAYRAVARAFPAHRIVLAAPEPLRDLATRCGAFDDLVAVEPLRPLPEALHGADVAVDLHGRGPASMHVLLATRARRLVSFAHEDVPQTRGSAAWIAGEHEVARWCRMLEGAGIRADRRDLVLAKPAPLAGAAGSTIVHPGAASGSRRWPVERFAVVARAERRRGRRVLVTGSSAEREIALEVARLADLEPTDVVAGATSLGELAALVAHAGRVICGDTGISHLATAFETPSVTLFGPTPPSTWGPPARPIHRVLWKGDSGDPHASEPDAGLLAIGIDEVRAELERL